MKPSGIWKWTPYAVVLLLFWVLLVGFDFNGLYGQDAHEYLRYGKALRTSWDTGTGAGAFKWPKLYPFLGAVLSYTGLSVVHAMQLWSLLACLGALFFTQKIFRLLYNTDGTWILVLGAATQVYFVRSGMFVMSDIVAAFFVIACAYYALRADRSKAWGHFLLMLGVALAAVFTRYAAVPLALTLCLFGTYRFSLRWSPRLRIMLYLLMVICGVMVLWFNNRTASEAIHILKQWNVRNLFVFERFNGVRMEHSTVPNGVYIWSNFAHLGYLSFGALLFFWIKKWNWKATGIWLTIGIYLLFIAGLDVQNQRFLVLTHLLVLVLVFPAFVELKQWLTARKLWWPFVVGVSLVNAGVFYYSFSKLYAIHRFEKELVQELQSLEDDKIIYTFYVNQSFASYDLPNPDVNLWYQDTDFQPGNYAVYNPELFGADWKGSSVAANWERLNKEFILEEVRELPQNWKLYRIYE